MSAGTLFPFSIPIIAIPAGVAMLARILTDRSSRLADAIERLRERPLN